MSRRAAWTKSSVPAFAAAALGRNHPASRSRPKLTGLSLRFGLPCLGLIVAAALNWSGVTHAQKGGAQFKSLGIEQGLSQHTVRCLLQDGRGCAGR